MLTLSGPSQCMRIPIDHMYSVLYSPYCTVHGPTATVHGPTTTVYFVDQSGVKPETVHSVCQFLVPWIQSCTDTDDPINSLRPRLVEEFCSGFLGIIPGGLGVEEVFRRV
jgi:hypothetical protein